MTHLPHPPIFTPHALPAATLPIYAGLGQAPHMLACTPSGLSHTQGHKYSHTATTDFQWDLGCLAVFSHGSNPILLADINVFE